MPVPFLETIETDQTLPDRADVVVIGGGVAGICAALYLAEAGIRVVLCEKGVVAGEQSSRNWGWVRQMGRDPAELPLTIEALRLWRGLDARFSIDTGFRETGITYVANCARDVRNLTEWAGLAKAADMDTRLLDRSSLVELLPGISADFTTGLYTADDGRAEPGKAVPELAKAAKRLGVTILQNCAVRGLETSAGKTSAVVTERGTVATSTVVLAGGAWSRLFLGNLGVRFPQLKVIGTVARVDNVSGVPDMPFGGGDFAFRKRLDGGYSIALRNANVAPILPDSFRLFTDFFPTFLTSWHELKLRLGKQFVEELQIPRSWPLDGTSPFEKQRVIDPNPHEPFVRKSLAALKQAFPGFASARLTDTWAGTIDATPDAIPVIGPVTAVPGLYVSSGYSGHGFGIGPGAGKLMSDLVRGVTPVVDPHPFRFERFGKAHQSRLPAAA